MLNVYYSVGNVQIATLGVSQKNRIYFKIKFEKERIISFEPETIVSEYETTIREDLRLFLNGINPNTQKSPTD
jgi:hypothetical protein